MFSIYLTQLYPVDGSVRKFKIAFIIFLQGVKGLINILSFSMKKHKLNYPQTRFDTRDGVAVRLEEEGVGSDIIARIRRGGKK